METSQPLYTYAFLPPDATLVLPDGMAGPLERISAGALTALVEFSLDIDSLQTDDARLMRAVLHHDQVLRDAFEQTDLLPLRFGTCFRSPEDLQAHLQDNATVYQKKLARVAGKAEYTLRLKPILTPAPSISADTSGKAYFLAKKRQFQEQAEQQQQQQQERELLRQAIAQTHPHLRIAEPRDGMERFYILADFARDRPPVGDRPGPLENHLPEWQALCPNWDITLDAPLPPYHFV